MNGITEAVVTVATLIVGVALLALIVSRQSNTTGVISSAFGGFSNALQVAVSPVTGASMGATLGGFPSFN